MADKLTIGQDYSFRKDGKDLWTLYETSEDGKNGDGITEVRYHFGRRFNAEMKKTEYFGQVSLPGSVIRLLGKNRVTTSDEFFVCSFTYNLWAVKEDARKIESAKEKPREVEVVRRALTFLESMEDFQLLLEDFDILPLHQKYQAIPGLFRGLENGKVSIAYRTADGLLKSICQGNYPVEHIRFNRGFLHNRALELPSPTTSEEFEFVLDGKNQPSKEFSKLDDLLKSRGI
jgi:hypothetical protein